jgi:hypothetical protein
VWHRFTERSGSCEGKGHTFESCRVRHFGLGASLRSALTAAVRHFPQ